jgi:hypothetical protein
LGALVIAGADNAGATPGTITMNGCLGSTPAGSGSTNGTPVTGSDLIFSAIVSQA